MVAKRSTRKIISFADSFYRFKINPNQRKANNRFRFWSLDSFVMSWSLCLLYLTLFLFLLGFKQLPEGILWQLIFLLILYVGVIYFLYNQNRIAKKFMLKRIFLLVALALTVIVLNSANLPLTDDVTVTWVLPVAVAVLVVGAMAMFYSITNFDNALASNIFSLYQ